MDTFALLILILIFLAPGFLGLTVFYNRPVSLSKSSNIESPFSFISHALIVTIFAHIISSILFTDLSAIDFSLAFFELRKAYQGFSLVVTYSFGLDEISEGAAFCVQEGWRILFENDKTIYRYNLFVIGITTLGGYLSRKFVVYKGYDLIYPFLRYPNPYYYIFTGQNAYLKENRFNGFDDGEPLSANSFLEIRCYLNSGKIFQGMLAHVSYTQNGYENVVIFSPVELKITKNEKEDIKTIDSMKGQYMVIQDSNISTFTLNRVSIARKENDVDEKEKETNLDDQ